MRGKKINFEDTIWKTYWWLTILWLWKKAWYHQWLICRCNVCWKTIETRAYHILKWNISWCSCVNKKHKEIIWKKYWRLTIISEETPKNKRRVITAQCECWNIITTYLQNLISWHTKSCWCICVDVMKTKRKYWVERTRDMRIYTIWCDILWRTKWYSWKKHYFDKWIKCKWKNFEEFFRDMWESYEKHCKEFWEKETTIDRIDCNWDYCKDNCRWATHKEQYLNRDCMKNSDL